MRKITIALVLLASCFATASKAQTVATFEDLPLSSFTDTVYVNYSSPGHDVGFNDGLAHFPSIFDTSSFMGTIDSFLSYGFVYSTDTVSGIGGFTNQYSAKPGMGYNSSHTYAIAYGQENILKLTGTAVGKPVQGFFISNNSYAYYSMKYGDAFAKKFGGGKRADSTGSEPDFFKVTIRGYSSGVLTTDSVVAFLADFTSSDSTQKYILDSWQWVNLLPLGHVDSLQFSLSSSDNGQFGMNTPAYFCMDNFTTNETNVSVKNVAAPAVKVYPNPATNILFVERTGVAQSITIMDMAGRIIQTYEMNTDKLAINTADLAAGTYLLQVSGNGNTASMKFIKQ